MSFPPPTGTPTPTHTPGAGLPARAAVALKTAPAGDSEGLPVTLRLILGAAIAAVVVAAGLFAVVLDRTLKARKARRKGTGAPAPFPARDGQTVTETLSL
ncbi:hypothetical protein [Planomonospora alba]|uniref:hypothetical protein n=1 Tax=Planomonospora alba TaxID=161354 RepID=UPI0031EF2891